MKESGIVSERSRVKGQRVKINAAHVDGLDPLTHLSGLVLVRCTSSAGYQHSLCLPLNCQRQLQQNFWDVAKITTRVEQVSVSCIKTILWTWLFPGHITCITHTGVDILLTLDSWTSVLATGREAFSFQMLLWGCCDPCSSTSPGEGNSGVKCSPFVPDLADSRLVQSKLFRNSFKTLSSLLSTSNLCLSLDTLLQNCVIRKHQTLSSLSNELISLEVLWHKFTRFDIFPCCLRFTLFSLVRANI